MIRTHAYTHTSRLIPTASTYHHVRKLFTWAGLKSTLEEFVCQLSICQARSPPPNTQAPIPAYPMEPWRDLTMDVIEGLPKSKGCDFIVVIVDRLTKYAHLCRYGIHSMPCTSPAPIRRISTNFIASRIRLSPSGCSPAPCGGSCSIPQHTIPRLTDEAGV